MAAGDTKFLLKYSRLLCSKFPELLLVVLPARTRKPSNELKQYEFKEIYLSSGWYSRFVFHPVAVSSKCRFRNFSFRKRSCWVETAYSYFIFINWSWAGWRVRKVWNVKYRTLTSLFWSSALKWMVENGVCMSLYIELLWGDQLHILDNSSNDCICEGKHQYC